MSTFKQLTLGQINASTLGAIVTTSNKNFIDISTYLNKVLESFVYNDSNNSIYLASVKGDHIIATEDITVISGTTSVFKVDAHGSLVTKNVYSELSQSDKTILNENSDATNHAGILGEIVWTGSGFYGYTTIGWRSFTAAGGSGDINFGENVGLYGVGVFDSQTTDTLKFKNIDAGSSKIIVTDNPSNHTIEIDAYITKNDVGLGNVPNVDTTNPSNIIQNTTHRFVTDAQIASWDEGGGLLFEGSIVRNLGSPFDSVTLVNDSVSPGNTKYYGTDGSGVKGYFSIPLTLPGGLNTHIQYNNGGTAFGGSANFTYDGTNVYLNGKLGLGETTPLAPIHNVSETSNLHAYFDYYGNTNNNVIRMRRALGTKLSPATTTTGNALGVFAAHGWINGTFTSGSQGSYQIYSGGTWTAGVSTPARLTMWNTKEGSITTVETLRIDEYRNIRPTGVSSGSNTKTNEFFYLHGVAGVPSGVPDIPANTSGGANVSQYTYPIVLDVTNSSLYYHNGSSWINLTPKPFASTFTNADLDGSFYYTFNHNLGALGCDFTVTDPNGYRQPVIIKDISTTSARIEFGGPIDLGTWIIRGRL